MTFIFGYKVNLSLQYKHSPVSPRHSFFKVEKTNVTLCVANWLKIVINLFAVELFKDFQVVQLNTGTLKYVFLLQMHALRRSCIT